ncbi:hemolysin E [Escherichia coli]|uniref:hemolysin E n=1 Tax=Escherichia coli TaxID=562 RepID=UPI003D9E32BD
MDDGITKLNEAQKSLLGKLTKFQQRFREMLALDSQLTNDFSEKKQLFPVTGR